MVNGHDVQRSHWHGCEVGVLVTEMTVPCMILLHKTGVCKSRTQSQQPNEQHHDGHMP